jgi:hypothetical protein
MKCGPGLELSRRLKEAWAASSEDAQAGPERAKSLARRMPSTTKILSRVEAVSARIGFVLQIGPDCPLLVVTMHATGCLVPSILRNEPKWQALRSP